jgi:hypothetical protein
MGGRLDFIHFIIRLSGQQKNEIRRWFRDNKLFPNAIGVVDGVEIVLQRGPPLDTKAWITRKSNFGMGGTGVVDHRGIFTFFSTGYPGSIHDATAFKSTDLYRNKDEYFQGEDYLLADAAYPMTSFMVPRYKAPSVNEARFNALHGSARVVVEHGFGMPKQKFPSLSCLSVDISSARGMRKASRWVLACVVIHNFIRLDANGVLDELEVANVVEDADNDIDNEFDDNQYNIDDAARNERREGPLKRNQLKVEVLRLERERRRRRR